MVIPLKMFVLLYGSCRNMVHILTCVCVLKRKGHMIIVNIALHPGGNVYTLTQITSLFLQQSRAARNQATGTYTQEFPTSRTSDSQTGESDL